MPTRVLHVIPGVAPCYGGPSQAVIELSAALKDLGLHSDIATTDANGRGRLPVNLGAFETYKGVRVVFFSRQAGDSIKYSRPMAAWLRDHAADYDVVHIHGIFSHQTISASRACLRAGIPYIVRPMGMLDPWSMGQKPIRKFAAWHLIFKQCLRRAAAVHYTSEAERSEAERSLKLSRGAVIPIGVRPEITDPSPAPSIRGRKGIPSNEPYILALSRIHPKKGFEILLDAFAGLLKSNPEAIVHLAIAGDGERPYVESLEARARALSCEGNVHWAGWLDGDEKRSAMQEARVFVLPSYQENFGIAAVEAMACGAPVIVSRHVGLARDIEEARAGWVIDLGKIELVGALNEAMRHPEDCAERGMRGRDLVRARFTWPRIAEAVAELYRQVVASKTSA